MPFASCAWILDCTFSAALCAWSAARSTARSAALRALLAGRLRGSSAAGEAAASSAVAGAAAGAGEGRRSSASCFTFFADGASEASPGRAGESSRLGAGAAGASSAIGAGASGARSGSDIPARRATEAALKTLDLFLAEPSGLCGGGREPARFQRRAADGFTPRSSRGSSAGSSPEPRVPIDRCDPSRLGRSSDPDPGSLSRPSRGIVRGAAAETRSKRSRSRDHSKKARAERSAGAWSEKKSGVNPGSVNHVFASHSDRSMIGQF